MADFFCFNNLKYLLGSSSRSVEVSASLKEGSVLLVKGPSGAGKSTLLRVLARLQGYTGGQVFLNGVGMFSFSPQAWRSKVHYVPQKPVVFPGSVRDNLLRPFNLKINKNKKFDIKGIQGLLKDLMLDPDIMEQSANTLSGGEIARIALLRSVILEPNILLLDEPTAALDKNAKQAVLDFLTLWLKQLQGRGIILVSHADESTVFPTADILNIGGDEDGTG